MLRVLGRVGIVAGSNGIFAPDKAIPALGDEFTAALVLEHVPGGVDGLALRAVQAGCPARIVALIGPLVVRTAIDGAISVLAHVWLRCSKVKGKAMAC